VSILLVVFIMGLVYHDGMQVPRQEVPSETGRVNQKRRTRVAIVDAAKGLLDQGITPTVAQAAEVALVSRSTAYRYFPTQESLLIEVTVHLDVDEIEQVVTAPVARGQARERTLTVIEMLNRHVFDAEASYRTAMRLYLDLWLAAAAEGDDAPVVREGRRRRWIEDSLAPLRGEVDDERWEHLIAALCVLAGSEAMVVLRDVCRMDTDDALAVTGWAADVLLRETFGNGSRRDGGS
jgi:AcrR family transcriptional regulator